MAPLAIFGITNDGLNLAVNLLLLFLVVLWLALVYWTYADAKRRIADPMLVGCAAAAALFPFVGTIVYMVVRPPEFLEDVHEREIEIAAAEARLAAAQEQACPYCEHPVERSFLRCPSCRRRLKQPCETCGKPLDPRWEICPYCEAEVAHAPAKERKRERRRDRPPARTQPRAPAAGEAEQRPKGERRPPTEPRRERASAPADAPTEVERPSGPPARQ
ncbi:MAG: zinc ribbon domain-containing protein [Thermoleophilaceae bacterium]